MKSKPDSKLGYAGYIAGRHEEKSKIKEILSGKVAGELVDLGHVIQIIYPNGTRFTCNSVDAYELDLMKKGVNINDVCEK